MYVYRVKCFRVNINVSKKNSQFISLLYVKTIFDIQRNCNIHTYACVIYSGGLIICTPTYIYI